MQVQPSRSNEVIKTVEEEMKKITVRAVFKRTKVPVCKIGKIKV